MTPDSIRNSRGAYCFSLFWWLLMVLHNFSNQGPVTWSRALSRKKNNVLEMIFEPTFLSSSVTSAVVFLFLFLRCRTACTCLKSSRTLVDKKGGEKITDILDQASRPCNQMLHVEKKKEWIAQDEMWTQDTHCWQSLSRCTTGLRKKQTSKRTVDKYTDHLCILLMSST